MPAYHPHSCSLESSRGGQSPNSFIYVFDSTGEMIGAFRSVVKLETVERMVSAVKVAVPENGAVRHQRSAYEQSRPARGDRATGRSVRAGGARFGEIWC